MAGVPLQRVLLHALLKSRGGAHRVHKLTTEPYKV
eukprot:COSAG02_NODE_54880_length_293_cov_1.335052_2_plen_34_part_01